MGDDHAKSGAKLCELLHDNGTENILLRLAGLLLSPDTSQKNYIYGEW